MKHTTLIWVCITISVMVKARQSPNADLVERFLDSNANWMLYPLQIAEDGILDVPNLIRKYKYPVEVHKVVTTDGFILEAHRICSDAETPTKNPPVLFMHGLLGSSADFIILGPNKSLGYMVADAGYDVWLLNARGNYYSRDHSTLRPENTDFWKFSWDEIGNLDLSAYIEYILDTTKHPKVHYVGHSQGATAFLVLISLNPAYNEKVLSFHGLAPAVFFTHNKNAAITTIANFESIVKLTATAMGYVEVSNEFPSWLLDNYCANVSILRGVCDDILNELSESKYRNSSMLPVILGHTPAGASVRQLVHFAQLIKSDQFRRYSHNVFTNLRIYGSAIPPNYRLNLVTLPTYLYYGLNDNLANYQDIVKLSQTLPNVVLTFKIYRDSFNHYDFIWATDAPQQLYYSLIHFINDIHSKKHNRLSKLYYGVHEYRIE